MNRSTKILAVLLTVCLVLGSSLTAWAGAMVTPSMALEEVLDDTCTYLLKTVPDPQVGSIGGEWAVIGLARSGCEVPPNWYKTYYENLEAEVIKKQGVLHKKKYTEYSRVVLALTAMGKDPTDVGGYNLLEKLGDFDKVVWQGINGPIFALLALDARDYVLPTCEDARVQTTRELLIDTIIKQQLSNGGFSLSGKTGDVDITAMVLQALAPYQERAGIKAVIDKAVAYLSQLQNSNGGYASWGTANPESVVQVLVALTALGIDPGTDNRFIKNGNTLIDNLMTFYVAGGGFKHTLEHSEPNGMMTEQGFYGLAAYDRFLKGHNSLYNMNDVQLADVGQSGKTSGRSNKNLDVKIHSITEPDKTFKDITNHPAQTEITALASRGIINGVTDNMFDPSRTMTRAEFATIMVKTLGFVPQKSSSFTDVPENSWYNGYVGAAVTYGIIKGRSDTVFAPQDTITREEAAVMLARAARLCGLDSILSADETRDLLAQFEDYVESSQWSREALALGLKKGFIPQDRMTLRPKEPITRSETAVMIYNLLAAAGLLGT